MACVTEGRLPATKLVPLMTLWLRGRCDKRDDVLRITLLLIVH